jgi:hypothetical protein
MKTYGGVEVELHHGSEWSASRPCRLTPGETAPGTHWEGGWVGPKAGLDAAEKRKIVPLQVVEP